MSNGLRFSVAGSLLLHALVGAGLAYAFGRVVPGRFSSGADSLPGVVVGWALDEPGRDLQSVLSGAAGLEEIPRPPKLAVVDDSPWPAGSVGNASDLLAQGEVFAVSPTAQQRTPRIGVGPTYAAWVRGTAAIALSDGGGGSGGGAGSSGASTGGGSIASLSENGSAAKGDAWGNAAPKPLAGNPVPAYPRAEERAGTEGSVRIRITIGEDGRVRRAVVTVSSGSEALDKAGLVAIRRWRFEAVGGGASEVNVEQEFRFSRYR